MLITNMLNLEKIHEEDNNVDTSLISFFKLQLMIFFLLNIIY